MVLYSFEYLLSVSTILEGMDVVENKTQKKKKKKEETKKTTSEKEIKW